MGKKKVFIIEDEESAFVSLKQLLISSDFEVEGVMDSKRAVERLRFFKPDIILLDLLMPGLGGLELCQILNDDKDMCGIPIIVISALGREEDVKKAYGLGVVDYVTKPYDFNEIEKKINKFIKYKKQED